ncbi:putative necrosis-inducing factor-domain-containing protein [Paraphoma chrysanthemicola]|uniref:Necrosis-inducing factor-domain-containing protein n=1 Tax=Paraphoma chrysanthemicola TaxID=798071 RepID=A0A8K0VW39_9PLEO|nr:putative necrosis-inducing factor-domain-containing protein [Paraphoma chrysanthemicola]
MQIQILALFTTLLAVTQAAPAAGKLDARNWVNDCGDSTFVNQSSGGSPLIADCQQIVRNIAGGGTWTVSVVKSHRQLVSYGTCVFGVDGDGGGLFVHVGNGDISDLINDSIKRFAWQGKVGAKGHMQCQNIDGGITYAGLNWGLYHT